MKARKTNIPETSAVGELLPADYADAFRCDIPGGAAFTPDDLMIAFWTEMPGWINAMMKLRNALVKPFGLKGGNGGDPAELAESIRNGKTYRFFSVAAKSDNETVVLLADTHLNAWISVMIDGGSVYTTTLVKYNNRLGKAYFFIIRPFHKIIVRSMLGHSVEKTARKEIEKRERTL